MFTEFKLVFDNLQRQREQKESNFDLDRLASARKRLQENYKEAENGLLCLFLFLAFNHLYFFSTCTLVLIVGIFCFVLYLLKLKSKELSK